MVVSSFIEYLANGLVKDVPLEINFNGWRLSYTYEKDLAISTPDLYFCFDCVWDTSSPGPGPGLHLSNYHRFVNEKIRRQGLGTKTDSLIQRIATSLSQELQITIIVEYEKIMYQEETQKFLLKQGYSWNGSHLEKQF